MIIEELRFVNILNINQKKLIIKSNKKNNKKNIFYKKKLINKFKKISFA